MSTAVTGGRRVPRYDFDPRIGALTPFERACRNVAVAVILVNAVLALASGHRAIWQVQWLDVRASDVALRPGTRVSGFIQTSGRNPTTLRLELVQGTRTVPLAERVVPGNFSAAMNPWPRRDSVAVVLTPELLSRVAPGHATIRVTGLGRSQWLRVPPPEVRERRAEIAPR